MDIFWIVIINVKKSLKVAFNTPMVYALSVRLDSFCITKFVSLTLKDVWNTMVKIVLNVKLVLSWKMVNALDLKLKT